MAGKGRDQTRGQVTQEEKCAAAVDVGRPYIAPTEKGEMPPVSLLHDPPQQTQKVDGSASHHRMALCPSA